MSDDRMQGIDVFVQAAEAGSFALAAERMRVTRSAIAKSIARLEQRVGTRLFHRTTRKQTLTEHGQAYYERCKRALAEIDAAEAIFDDGRREPAGRLRVSAPVIFGRHYVAPVLTALASRHTRLAIELSFSNRFVDIVEEGFDLVVRFGPLRDSTSLMARRLATEHWVMCAAPSYLAQRGRPEGPDDFSGHVAIAYLWHNPAPWQVRDRNGRLPEFLVNPRLRFDDVQAIADAALGGAGIARLPLWLAMPHVRAGQLVLLPETEADTANEIHAVWPHTRYLPAKTRAAIDALAKEIPAMMA